MVNYWSHETVLTFGLLRLYLRVILDRVNGECVMKLPTIIELQRYVCVYVNVSVLSTLTADAHF